MKVPFGFLALSEVATSVSSSSSPLSKGVSLLPRLSLRLVKKLEALVGEGGISSDTGACWPSLNTWIVSVAEDTHSSVAVMLKDIEKIRDGIDPRRNWYNLCASGTEKTRMIVPLSEAVASTVPSLFSTTRDNGDRCASTTFMASSLIVSKSNTSPVVGTIWALVGGAWAGGAKAEAAAF